MKLKAKSRFARVDFRTVRRLYAHFGFYVLRYRSRLLISMISLLGVSALTLLTPWPLKLVFDYALLPGHGAKQTSWLAPLAKLDPWTVVALAAVAVLALAVLRGVFNYTHQVVSAAVGHRLVVDIRLQLFGHIQRLPQAYHDFRETGELMTRLTGDIGLLEDLLTTTATQLISQVLLITGMFAVMFWLDPTLALATVAVTPLFLFAAFRFSMRIKTSARRQRDAYGRMVASVQESIAGIAHVKSFGQERNREKLVGKSIERDLRVNVRTARLSAGYARVVDIITAIGTCLVLWLGARRVLAGQITAGDLLVFLSYMRGVYRPVRDMAKLSARIAKASVRGEKIMEILEMTPEVSDRPGAISADQIRGDIEFRNVRFAYVPGRPVLHNLSCHIPIGRTTAVIGRTGAGKSTVAKLILRLYDPQEGAVLLDGHNVRDFRLRSLRKRVTPMSQDTFLFRTTLAENIAFGKKNATREEVEEAARLVGADEFIRSMPDGYDTEVGEGGLTLSGGQRQRISFARAALRRSPVMIFDEPATGLDIHAEREAMNVLRRLRTDRTLIIITHRLRFLELADWIILIEKGRVIEEGPIETLQVPGTAFHEYTRTTAKRRPASDDSEIALPHGMET